MDTVKDYYSLLQKPRYYGMVISLMSIIAMSGSLYFSEILHLYPCKLCWFQRILMYPLVAIGIYTILTEKRLYGLIGFMSSLGILISGYHSTIQRMNFEVCSGVCSHIQYTVGPVTIPNLALITFILILVATGISYRTNL